MNRKCEFCGSRISKNDTFCKDCGMTINKKVTDAVVDDRSSNKDFKLSNTTIYIIIGFIIIIFILLLI